MLTYKENCLFDSYIFYNRTGELGFSVPEFRFWPYVYKISISESFKFIYIVISNKTPVIRECDAKWARVSKEHKQSELFAERLYGMGDKQVSEVPSNLYQYIA